MTADLPLGAETLEASAALVVVDVQNDFADPKGALYVHGGEGVVAAVEALIAARPDAFAVYTQDWHPPSTPHFEKDGGIWPTHCVAGTWGAELHPGLSVVGPVVRKGTGGEDGYSGFSVRDPRTGAEAATELEGILRARGIERVVVVGLAQDVCVKATALDAVRLGFETVVLADATRPVARRPGDGARAIVELVKAGVEVR